MRIFQKSLTFSYLQNLEWRIITMLTTCRVCYAVKPGIWSQWRKTFRPTLHGVSVLSNIWGLQNWLCVWFIDSSVCLSLCFYGWFLLLFVYLSVCESVWLSACLPACLPGIYWLYKIAGWHSFYYPPPFYPVNFQFWDASYIVRAITCIIDVCPSFSLSLYLYVYLPAFLSVCRSFSLSIYVFVCLSTSLFIVDISISAVFLSICLSVVVLTPCKVGDLYAAESREHIENEPTHY